MVATEYRQAGARFFPKSGLILAALLLSFPLSRAHSGAANTLFVELLGNGLLYSLNYDRLFAPNVSGRVGYMYFSAPAAASDETDTVEVTVSLHVIPVTVNYLVGQGNHKLELGGGILIVMASAEVEGVGGFAGKGTGGTATLGYRYHPSDGGLNFRIGFTPVFAPEFQPWGGLSLGYSF